MRIHSNSLGSALRRARLELGIGQTDLAKTLNISVWCLSRVESGTRAFDTDWLDRMPDSLYVAVKNALTEEIDAIPPSSRQQREDVRAVLFTRRAPIPGVHQD
jgi:ribosome-binding protein aMBF1 (putative translation factor)